MYRDRRARWGGCALPPEGPAGAGRGRERPSTCAAPARFAGEGALRPRSAAASALGLLWSAGGVGRGVGAAAWDPRSATDFAAEVAVPGAAAAGLARTGVLPPQVSRPAGGADSAATAKVPAPPFPRADSFARTALPAPGCCHRCSCPPAAALRVALARLASPAKVPRLPALPASSAPAPGPRLPPGGPPLRSPLRPRGGRPGS